MSRFTRDTIFNESVKNDLFDSSLSLLNRNFNSDYYWPIRVTIWFSAGYIGYQTSFNFFRFSFMGRLKIITHRPAINVDFLSASFM